VFVDALPLSYTGTCFMVLDVLGVCSKCLYAPVRFDDDTDNPFRSSALGVMSPARYRCAISVKYGLYE
jgi:hypothetical protein